MTIPLHSAQAERLRSVISFFKIESEQEKGKKRQAGKKENRGKENHHGATQHTKAKAAMHSDHNAQKDHHARGYLMDMNHDTGDQPDESGFDQY